MITYGPNSVIACGTADKPVLRGVSVHPSKAEADHRATELRAAFGWSCRVYERRLKVDGLRVMTWAVVSRESSHRA